MRQQEPVSCIFFVCDTACGSFADHGLTGLRFEINFSESAILGMIGAGGIGFAIANNIQGYQFGAAGLAIVLVFVFAYCVELVFTTIKKNYI
ncbi:MAG: PhnE/PtxC family ABC transporter permease [Phascolarctobacterium faecium]